MTFEKWLAESGESASVTTRKKMKQAYEAGRLIAAGEILALLGQDPCGDLKLLKALEAVEE